MVIWKEQSLCRGQHFIDLCFAHEGQQSQQISIYIMSDISLSIFKFEKKLEDGAYSGIDDFIWIDSDFLVLGILFKFKMHMPTIK